MEHTKYGAEKLEPEAVDRVRKTTLLCKPLHPPHALPHCGATGVPQVLNVAAGK